MSLKVADLFCGGGGISQGLAQAGLDIIYGADKNRAAAETFQKNHPGSTTDVVDVSDFDLDSIPDFDVLVGGPPCIEFSASKGSRGNILEGLRLVQAYLRVVYERSPKYWIMENVPRIVLHLPEEIPLSWIGIKKKGSLHIPVRAEYNCADYGVPQARKRFLMGNYPLPEATHTGEVPLDLFPPNQDLLRWNTLADVLAAFPSPMNPTKRRFVTDPNYGTRLPLKLLTDHFHTVELSEREARSIRRAKESHPYMGFMPFPDRTEVPARTVVATQLGRETLIIQDMQRDRVVYRRATIRECASLQSFPISYQFFGNSLGGRYRIVGDAVPPRLSNLIGTKLLEKDGLELPLEPVIAPEPINFSPSPVEKPRKGLNSPMRINRKFSELVPGKEVRGCRVDLNNLGEHPRQAQLFPKGVSHITDWCARLYLGEGRASLRYKDYDFEQVLATFSQSFLLADHAKRLKQTIGKAEEVLPKKLCDATTLQAVWTNRSNAAIGPEQIVDLLSGIVDQYFPKELFSDVFLPIESESFEMPKRGIRIRLAVGLIVTAYAADQINCGVSWLSTHSKKRYIPESWPPSAGKSTEHPISDAILNSSAYLECALERTHELV